MILRFSTALLLFLFIFLVTSCGSRKDLVYFQEGPQEGDTLAESFSPVYEVNDLLSIQVTAADPEIAKPFNQAEMVQQGNQITSYENGVPATYGYLVGADSTVSLPIVGKVKVGGLDRSSAVDTVEKALTAYLSEPRASIRILNFKISVLGEVKNPGTFYIPNERVTILEAVGIAKDLKITGVRDNVMVIRHVDGKEIQYRVDLTSNEVFKSPVYYLKQNDVVYVEPNSKARFDSSILKSTSGLMISTTSLIVSTLVLIFK